MPRQVKSKEEIESLIQNATEIRLVKRDDRVKMKLRTKKFLYTYVTTQDESESILKNVKTEIVEL